MVVGLVRVTGNLPSHLTRSTPVRVTHRFHVVTEVEDIRAAEWVHTVSERELHDVVGIGTEIERGKVVVIRHDVALSDTTVGMQTRRLCGLDDVRPVGIACRFTDGHCVKTETRSHTSDCLLDERAARQEICLRLFDIQPAHRLGFEQTFR